MDKELLSQILKLKKIKTRTGTVNKRSTEPVLKISPSIWQIARDEDGPATKQACIFG